MEKDTFEVAAAVEPALVVPATAPRASDGCAQWPQWPSVPPTLINRTTTLRELRSVDAPSLLEMISTEEVSRFICSPPTTLEGYNQFIEWSHRRRAEGRYICFGVIPDGFEVAVGIFQLQVRPGDAPEWGFAIGSPFWGTGLFVDGAEAVLDFAFRGMGLRCLGARAAVENSRGNRALQKIGAVCERVIPQGLIKNGRPLDEHYWTVPADGRPHRKVIWK